MIQSSTTSRLRWNFNYTPTPQFIGANHQYLNGDVVPQQWIQQER